MVQDRPLERVSEQQKYNLSQAFSFAELNPAKMGVSVRI